MENKFTINDQVVADPLSGLTFEFKTIDMKEGKLFKISIYGDNLPFGNRDLYFNENGVFDGTGTCVTNCPIVTNLQ